MAIDIQGIKIGGDRFTVIAGPCQIETSGHAIMMAGRLQDIAAELDVNLVYKSSFDKANRTSIQGQRGPGMQRGLEILDQVRTRFGCATLTDIHHPEQAQIACQAGVSILQIPALLSRQTDLLIAAGESGAAVNIKKGQFMAPADMIPASAKVLSTGNDRVMLTERGITHGYRDLVVDMRSFRDMAQTGLPIVFDCTHSTQSPGSQGHSSGGDGGRAAELARAAVATGWVDAVFLETHQDPDSAPSDGAVMVPVDQVRDLVRDLRDIWRLVREQAHGPRAAE